ERRRRLERLLRDPPPMLTLTTVHAANVDAHREVIHLGFEGSVVKRADSRYVRGQRTRAWLKVKQRQEADVFVRFANRDRRTGAIDRAAFTEPDVPGLQWATVGSAHARAALEAGARDAIGRIAF